MTGKLREVLPLAGGEWVVSFTVGNPGDLESLKGKTLRIDVRKASNPRSLQANNYAWLLIDQIAEKTGEDVSAVYRHAIREIGGVADYYGMKEEAYERFCEIWTAGHLGRQVEIIPGSSKPGWVNVKAWKGSSDFDSAQMARLIDSLIQEADAQGIPTITPQETERMLGRWGKGQSSSKTAQGALSAAG